jgi:glycine betaine/proline transport system substrate-binding protein
VKEAFDRNGDGKADLVACPPGWGCELVIEHHLDEYGLRDYINPIKASYSASMADAIAANEQGDPILFYTWTPNWTVNELVPGEDVMWIGVPYPSLPEEQAELEDATSLEGVTGCVDDPCLLGFPANDIRPVANSEFLDQNPAVRALLEEMSIPLEAIFAQNAKMNAGEGDQEAIERHAEEWIENNRETFDGWIEAAMQAATQ